MGEYKTVVIDPSWPLKFDKRIPEALRRQEGKWAQRTVELEYPTQSLEDIRNFPIDDFAAKEALLFLWVTTGKIDNVPILKIGMELLETWGFKYHQMITWCKLAGLAMWSPINSRTEHALFGYRGNLPEVYGAMPSYFVTKQLSHSEKPARFYQLLRSWTPAPRIDLFARRAHEGFDGWGNEYVHDGPLAPFLEQTSEKGSTEA